MDAAMKSFYCGIEILKKKAKGLFFLARPFPMDAYLPIEGH